MFPRFKSSRFAGSRISSTASDLKGASHCIRRFNRAELFSLNVFLFAMDQCLTSCLLLGVVVFTQHSKCLLELLIILFLFCVSKNICKKVATWIGTLVTALLRTSGITLVLIRNFRI